MSNAWQSFIAGEKQLSTVDPLVYRSWQRSRDNKVNSQHVINYEILPAPRLKERCQEHEDLIQAGKPVLACIFRYLKNSNHIVQLIDNDGYILEVLGDPPFINKVQKVHLSPGANWREEIMGTNAIGTAIVEQTPITILGWEHYVQAHHFISCWSSPIRNHTGKITGVLNISGDAGISTNKNLVEISVMGARLIEQNLQIINLKRNSYFYKQVVNLVGEMRQKGFIAINDQGIIAEINKTGARMLGYKQEEMIGQSVVEIFEHGKNWLLDNNFLNLPPKENPNYKIIPNLHQVVDNNVHIIGTAGTFCLVPKHKQTEKEPEEQFLWVGHSAATKEVFKRAKKVSQTDSTVLIQGESGTGKEVVARYIHHFSARKKSPFIAVNCAAIPATLIESELFGYSKGAFTGAKREGHPGKFELAQGGTIFLDEIGDAPFNVQSSLLRVLQEKKVFRIGDTRLREIDVRIIVATNKDLTALVDKGNFRLDLFYRLKVVKINLPPLRQRIEDIFDLVPFFIKEVCSSLNKPVPKITGEVYSYFLVYSWPGNVRELKNCIESMIVMSEGSCLTAKDLPEEIKDIDKSLASTDQKSFLNQPVLDQPVLDQQTQNAVKFTILQALAKTKGKIAPAARLLGIGRTTLYRKIEKLGLKDIIKNYS